MTPEEQEERQAIKDILGVKLASYSRWAKTWSAVYHSALYIAAIASAVAVVILKLDMIKSWPFQSDAAAILAGIASVLSAATVAGSTDRKWRANRAARNALEVLKIDMTDPTLKNDEIRKRLEKIISDQSQGISGPER